MVGMVVLFKRTIKLIRRRKKGEVGWKEVGLKKIRSEREVENWTLVGPGRRGRTFRAAVTVENATFHRKSSDRCVRCLFRNYISPRQFEGKFFFSP